MRMTKKYNSQILLKITLLVIFIFVAIVGLFIAVPIIILLAGVVFILMLISGKKINRNVFFFKTNKPSFKKNRHSCGTQKQENSEYYDVEYISINDKDEK